VATLRGAGELMSALATVGYPFDSGWASFDAARSGTGTAAGEPHSSRARLGASLTWSRTHSPAEGLGAGRRLASLTQMDIPLATKGQSASRRDIR
jgi:hypothetical protein